MTEAAAPPPGFSEDPAGRRRWWDGSGWTDRYEVSPIPIAPGRSTTLSAAEQREILDRAVAKYVRHGYAVRFNSGKQAIVTRRQRVNVPLNVGLALLTGGLWAVVIAIRLLEWPSDRVVLTIDRFGVLTPEFS